jgi:hypothetical protein
MYGYWSSVTCPVSDCTVSYRPVLSSERAAYRKNNKAIVTKERIRIKSYQGSQRGYQDEVVDRLSAVRQAQLSVDFALILGSLKDAIHRHSTDLQSKMTTDLHLFQVRRKGSAETWPESRYPCWYLANTCLDAMVSHGGASSSRGVRIQW